ncbi:MAG: hypothetical protein JOZ78_17435 [Chroococcidiopsidaceae cyanobacterium CP_BM_ER_R8_30]|nr:hypothetical protein [Chroococcidiopsidaceae cyanobacterium CP_BM_ER_R8_30]
MGEMNLKTEDFPTRTGNHVPTEVLESLQKHANRALVADMQAGFAPNESEATCSLHHLPLIDGVCTFCEAEVDF